MKQKTPHSNNCCETESSAVPLTFAIWRTSWDKIIPKPLTQADGCGYAETLPFTAPTQK